MKFLGAFFLKIVSLFLSCATCIVLLEVGLRLAEPFFPSPYINVPLIGIKNKPFRGSANSAGFNDIDYPKEKREGVLRILALGDSFNSAGGYQGNYWTLVEKQLSQKGFGVIEVLNQGVTGTGPAHLMKLLKHESMAYHPDMVVLAFFVGNDLSESRKEMLISRFGYPAHLDDDRKSFDWMKDSYLYFYASWKLRCFREVYAKWKEKRAGLPGGAISEEKFLKIEKSFKRFCRRNFFETESWSETKRCLREYQEYLEARNVKFLVVLLPDVAQVDSDLRQRIIWEISKSKNEFIFNLPQKMLGEYLSALGVDYLDLLPLFIEKAKEGALYGFHGTHFNAKGNQVASRAVSEFLIPRISSLASNPR